MKTCSDARTRWSHVNCMYIQFIEPAPGVIFWRDTDPENRAFPPGLGMILASPGHARAILENEEAEPEGRE